MAERISHQPSSVLKSSVRKLTFQFMLDKARTPLIVPKAAGGASAKTTRGSNPLSQLSGSVSRVHINISGSSDCSKNVGPETQRRSKLTKKLGAPFGQFIRISFVGLINIFFRRIIHHHIQLTLDTKGKITMRAGPGFPVQFGAQCHIVFATP